MIRSILVSLMLIEACSRQERNPGCWILIWSSKRMYGVSPLLLLGSDLIVKDHPTREFEVPNLSLLLELIL
jgi:hypothetical protein